MATKSTLYLPDKLFGFRPATRHTVESSPEYGFKFDTLGWKLDSPDWKIPNTSRDSQKTKVYRAEWAIKGKINGRELDTIEQMREFLNESWDALDLKKGQYTNARQQIRKPTIKYHSKTGACTAYHAGWIGMSKLDWAANRLTILHEMAHFLCPHSELHGAMFTRTLLDLVTKFISPEVGSELFDNYLNGHTATRLKYEYETTRHADGRLKSHSLKDTVKTKRTTRPEVGSPRLGLARLGMQTGFSTGVPSTNLVSPIVARQIGMTA